MLRAIHPKHNPTQEKLEKLGKLGKLGKLEKLEKLLEPFGLRIGLAKVKQGKRKRAA